MKLPPAIVYMIVGTLIAEALVWGILLPWMHYRYTTGITKNLWGPVILLAILGAGLGFGAFTVRAARKGSG